MPHREEQNLIQFNLDYRSKKINELIPKTGDNLMSINKKILTSIKQKPYFSKDNFVLYKNDCLKVLEQLPENSIDMIFADPPYFLSSGSFTCQNGKMVSVKKGDWDLSNGLKRDFEFHFEWTKACHRVLKPGGTIWISGTYHSIYQCGFALQINKFHILNDISWFKPNASPNLSCRFFTASHETLIWARKDKKEKHKFNYELMKNSDWPEDFIKKPNLQMRSVWAIYPPKKEEKTFGKHPTQKPIDLLNRIVLASTDKNDIVLDPFTGSSTTGLACVLNNRKFVGIDTEKKYLDLSIKRFNELIKKQNNKLKI
jgi:site-specific DNA-methyltransferase (adenine-specific)